MTRSAPQPVNWRQSAWLLILLLGAGVLAWLGDPSRRLTESIPARPVGATAASSDPFMIHQIDLEIDQAAFQSLFQTPPESLRVWQSGFMLGADGSRHPVEVRGRGGHAWHWDARKPSLRLRFRDSFHLDGRTTIDLVNPDDAPMLANPLGDHLARKLGLIAAVTQFARVSLNGRLLGLYHLTDRFDTSFLRRNHLDEGPLWEGNSWRPTLWNTIDEWNQLDPSAPNTEAGKIAMQGLLSAVAISSPMERHQAIAGILDHDRFMRWMAFQSLVGSIHTDDRHNHLFWFDGTARRLVPLVLDSTGFGALTRAPGKTTGDEARLPLNEPLTPLTDALLRNPFDLQRRNRYLWEDVSNLASPASLHALVDRGTATIQEEVRKDTQRGVLQTVTEIGYPFRLPYSFAAFGSATRELHRWIDERAAYLREQLADAQVRLYRSDDAGGARLVIEVRGQAAVDWPLENDLPLIARDLNLDGVIAPEEQNSSGPAGVLTLYPGIRADPGAQVSWVMLEQRRLRYSLVPASQTYLIGLPTDQADRLIDRFRREARNAITGAPIPIEPPAAGFPREKLYKESEGIHPWSFSDDSPRSVR